MRTPSSVLSVSRLEGFHSISDTYMESSVTRKIDNITCTSSAYKHMHSISTCTKQCSQQDLHVHRCSVTSLHVQGSMYTYLYTCTGPVYKFTSEHVYMYM